MIKVALIIVHYKEIADTIACLRSVSKSKRSNIQLFINLIDNSSQSDITNELQSIALPLKYIPLPQNVGFAEGVNIGIRQGQKENVDYFVLLNSDTLVPPEFLSSFLQFANEHPSYSLISPKIYFAPGYEFHKDRYNKEDQGKVIWYAGGRIDWQNIYASHEGVDEIDQRQFDKDKTTDFVTGCCMLIRKDVINKIGFFDKSYFAYFEDVDYSVKAKQAGLEIGFDPGSYLWHKNAASSGKPGSPVHVYLQTRNRFYFGRCFADWRAKIHLLKEAILLLYSKNPAQKQASIDFLLGRMGKGSLKIFDKN